MPAPEKVFIAGIVREPNWLYFFDNGFIMRQRMGRGGATLTENERKPERLLATDVVREPGYIYFLDKQGDVSRCAAAPSNPSWSGVPAKKKTAAKKRGRKTMRRYFEYKDKKSNKFWEVEWVTSNSSFTTTWGPIGSLGTNKVKEFYSKSARDKELEKIVQEKVKKGYIEVKSKDTKPSKPEPAPANDPGILEIL